MSKFPSFMEYLNEKGRVVEKPEVEEVPDYHGSDQKTPPNSKVPYKTPVADKAPQKGEKGFAELGDGKLKYEPDTKLNYEVKKDVMKEYFSNKGKIVTKAKVDAKADYEGSTPKAPPGKGAKPYVSSSKKPGKDEGLGEMGSEELVYEPDTKTCKRTEGFLNKTKGMSLSEFTKYMLDECGCGQVEDDSLPSVTAYTTGKFQPHPPEVIRYISALANKNQGILENLVSQMVSMGYLGKLMKAVFDHPEAYEELTNMLGDEKDGPSRCGSLVGSMNNSYSKFISDQEGMYESVSSPMGFDDMEGDEDDMEGDEDDMEGDEDDMEGEEDDMEGDEDDMEGDEDDMEGDEDDMEGDEDDMEDHDGEDMEDHDGEDMEDHDGEDMGFDSAEEPRKRKLKKKFAHHHLLDAMKKHQNMMDG